MAGVVPAGSARTWPAGGAGTAVVVGALVVATVVVGLAVVVEVLVVGAVAAGLAAVVVLRPTACTQRTQTVPPESAPPVSCALTRPSQPRRAARGANHQVDPTP